MPSLSILIPALNESKNITDTFNEVVNALKNCKNISEFEIILINDGSTDGTPELMRQIASKNNFVTVIDNQINRGIGFCYRRSLETAKYDYHTWVPSDNTFGSASLSSLYREVGNADVVLHYPKVKNRRLHRKIISYLFIKSLNFLFNISNIQYYNGLAIYKRAMINDLKFRSDGFAFQAELLIKVIKYKKASLIQVPIFTTERKYGKTKLLRSKNVFDLLKTLYFLFTRK